MPSKRQTATNNNKQMTIPNKKSAVMAEKGQMYTMQLTKVLGQSGPNRRLMGGMVENC